MNPIITPRRSPKQLLLIFLLAFIVSLPAHSAIVFPEQIPAPSMQNSTKSLHILVDDSALKSSKAKPIPLKDKLNPMYFLAFALSGFMAVVKKT